jgi:hypothetical protein
MPIPDHVQDMGRKTPATCDHHWERGLADGFPPGESEVAAKKSDRSDERISADES